jgi:predicted dehydrogenase
VKTRTGPVGVGIVGAGNISNTYLENLNSFPDTTVVGVADLFPEAAQRQAERYGVGRSGTVESLLADDDVDIVVNLTTPNAHAEVASLAISAGKHVWNEKPLTVDRESAQALLKQADAAGVRIGGAPDTFLGSGLQHTRRLLEQGIIGTPLTALVLMQSLGPESWHPNPAFFFASGAGPLFDMGPYYLTAVAQIFGPVASLAATGSRARETRVVGSGPRAGEQITVSVPTHVSVLARYASGQSAVMIFSFDSAERRTVIEVNGSGGTAAFPDPNRFDGDVVLRRAQPDQPPEVLTGPPQVSSRGTGVLEMARAIRAGRPHRASGELAYHVLDTMISIEEAITSSSFVSVHSTFTLQPPLPDDWDPFAATL